MTKEPHLKKLTELIHEDNSGIIDRYSYLYDNIGRRIETVRDRRGLPEESGVYAYSYDAIGRLESVTRDGTLETKYVYDAFGNRVSRIRKDSTTAYTYNAMNQLVQASDADLDEHFEYDRRGNLIKRSIGGSTTHSYVYGAMGRLGSAINSKGGTARYLYNGTGQRIGEDIISTTDPERKIRYTIDLTREYHNLLERDVNGNKNSFIWEVYVNGLSFINSV